MNNKAWYSNLKINIMLTCILFLIILKGNMPPFSRVLLVGSLKIFFIFALIEWSFWFLLKMMSLPWVDLSVIKKLKCVRFFMTVFYTGFYQVYISFFLCIGAVEWCYLHLRVPLNLIGMLAAVSLFVFYNSKTKFWESTWCVEIIINDIFQKIDKPNAYKSWRD